MKQLIFVLLLALCITLSASGQQYVFDPQYLASVEANQAVRMGAEQTHNQYLDKINNNLNNLNLNVGSVVTAQTIIYNGLANVNSALKDGLEVKHLATITSDMISYLDQALSLAKSQPYLLVFVTGIANEMKARAVLLVSDVSGFVLKEGSNVLADYNGRDQLLRKIAMQLQILDSLAYGAWRAMYWASQQSLLTTLNPWQAYINDDKLFVQRIISKAKYLQANP